jgi:antitoxin HigA-1
MMHDPPHPGEILQQDYLEPLELSTAKVASGLGISRRSLAEILKGRRNVTPAMALRLGQAFDTTPEFWMNLQSQYELWQAQQEAHLEKVTVFHTPSPHPAH